MVYSNELKEKVADQIANISRLTDEYTIGESCSLEISNDGTLELATQDREDRSIGASVYQGVVQSIWLPDGVKPSSLAHHLNTHLPTVLQLIEGMESSWDEHANEVGTLTDKGREAKIALECVEHLDITDDMDAEDFYAPMKEEIISCKTEQEAINLCSSCLDNQGMTNDYEVDGQITPIFIGLKNAEIYARKIWHKSNDEFNLR